MTLNKIAWYIIKEYGVSKSQAFKLAANLIKQGAYDEPAAQVIAKIERAFAPEIPEGPGDDEDPYNTGWDVGDYEDRSDDYDELYDSIDDYAAETSSYDVEKSANLLKDILELSVKQLEGDGLTEAEAKTETYNLIEDNIPGFIDDIRNITYAEYHGSGYSKTEGKSGLYYSLISQLEGVLQVHSAYKWW